MACPTCGEIQDGVGDVPAIGGDAAFWCPRCGTLEMHTNGVSAFKTPNLIEGCRSYKRAIIANLPLSLLGVTAAQAWRVLGIAESINLPKDR